MALAGAVYRELSGRFQGRADGADAEEWDIAAEVYEDAMGSPRGLERRLGRLVDDALADAGLRADEASREALMVEAALAARQAARFNSKRAEGDFTEDPMAGRFPPKEAVSEPAAVPSGPSLMTLYGSMGAGAQGGWRGGEDGSGLAPDGRGVRLLSAGARAPG